MNAKANTKMEVSKSKMEEATTFYQKNPDVANVALFRVYAEGPTVSYSVKPTANDKMCLIISSSSGITRGCTVTKEIGQFKTFILNNNKTQEEYLAFLDDFLTSLGDAITLKSLHVVRGTGAEPVKKLFVDRFVSQVQDPVKRFEALRFSVFHRDEFVTRALLEHGVPHDPYIIALCRRVEWDDLADELDASKRR